MKKILPNYQQYWSCSTNKKGYSGVAFLVRSNEQSGSKQKTVKEMFSKKQDKPSSDNDEDCTNTISVRYGLGKKYENEKIQLSSSIQDRISNSRKGNHRTCHKYLFAGKNPV